MGSNHQRQDTTPHPRFLAGVGSLGSFSIAAGLQMSGYVNLPLAILLVTIGVVLALISVAPYVLRATRHIAHRGDGEPPLLGQEQHGIMADIVGIMEDIPPLDQPTFSVSTMPMTSLAASGKLVLSVDPDRFTYAKVTGARLSLRSAGGNPIAETPFTVSDGRESGPVTAELRPSCPRAEHEVFAFGEDIGPPSTGEGERLVLALDIENRRHPLEWLIARARWRA